MKSKNNMFIIDSADYFYPYTQYFSECLVKENFKVFFLQDIIQDIIQKKQLQKNYFIFFQIFFSAGIIFFYF